MPQRIVIEGDLVRTETYDTLGQVRLEDLLPRIENRPPVFIGPTPKTAKFLYWDESNPADHRVMILSEVLPALRQCRYLTRRYQIAVPWTYFLYQFRKTAGSPHWTPTDARVFWAREEVRTLDSMIGRALVPNCNASGSICYGSTGVDGTLPLDIRVDRLSHEFYATQFAHDSGAGSPWGSETGSTSWIRWATESRDDPQAWTRFPEWGREGHPGIPLQPVRQLLENAVREERATVVDVAGRIPDMTMPATFGRTEQWLRDLTPQQRWQIHQGLQNFIAEDPIAVIEPDPEAEEIDDIGEEVGENE